MLSKKPKSQFSLEFSCKKGEIIAILHHNSIEIELHKAETPSTQKFKKAETPTTPKF